MRVPPGRISAEVGRLLSLEAAKKRPVDVQALAEELGFNVVYQTMDGDEDISGFYLRDGEANVIGVNAGHPRVRRRFTIAHELGHALLDRAGTMHIDRAFMFKFRDPRSSLAIDPDEIAANSFAAQLLMPENEVRQRIAQGIDITDDRAVQEQARYFGVSQQAFTYRLLNLGLDVDGQVDFS